MKKRGFEIAKGFESTFGEAVTQSAEFQVTSSDDDLPF